MPINLSNHLYPQAPNLGNQEDSSASSSSSSPWFRASISQALGNIPPTPEVGNNKGDDSAINKQLELTKELVEFYEALKQGADEKTLDSLASKIRLYWYTGADKAFGGYFLGGMIEDIVNLINSTIPNLKEHAQQFLTYYHGDYNGDFFYFTEKWLLDSKTEKNINDFLDQLASPEEGLDFILNLISTTTCLENSGGKVLALAEKFIAETDLANSLPDVLYYYAYQQALKKGYSGPEAITEAKKIYSNLLNQLFPPSGDPGLDPGPLWKQVFNNLHHFNFNSFDPSSKDALDTIKIWLYEIQQGIARTLS